MSRAVPRKWGYHGAALSRRGGGYRMQRGTQMTEQQNRREAEYRELMSKAEQVTSGQTTVVVMPAGAPAEYMFPWEVSQYLATGSTSAEKGQ